MPDDPYVAVFVTSKWKAPMAAFIAAAPSTVEQLLGALERVEALADEWFRELDNPDHLILLEDALVAIRAAITGEGGA